MASRRKGRLIVLEGADGSGKSTQFRLLARRLKKERVPFETLKFPQYGKKSAGLVEEYLAGKYGRKPDDVHPYAASLFYALDRFDAAQAIRKWLDQGKLVLLDRYVDSNAGHQGAKIKDAKKQKAFLRWLYDIEYGLLNIPKPNCVIILHAPESLGNSNSTKKRDIHEADGEYLRRVRKMYLQIAHENPGTHVMIHCFKNDKALAPEEIHRLVWHIVQKTT